MTIQEMHQTFRVFAQQMGMQLVRAILPEEIDVYLNSAIIEKVKEVVFTNTNTVFNDRISIQDNSISPINYIRTLYKQKELGLTNKTNEGFYIEKDNDIMFYTYVSLVYEEDGIVYGARLIEPDKLHSTLRDFCNGASFDYPIVSIYNIDEQEVIKTFTGGKEVEQLIINYIANPVTVSYKENINCDLPEYTHNDIVQLACQKYFVSVDSTTHNVNN